MTSLMKLFFQTTKKKKHAIQTEALLFLSTQHVHEILLGWSLVDMKITYNTSKERFAEMNALY